MKLVYVQLEKPGAQCMEGFDGFHAIVKVNFNHWVTTKCRYNRSKIPIKSLRSANSKTTVCVYCRKFIVGLEQHIKDEISYMNRRTVTQLFENLIE